MSHTHVGKEQEGKIALPRDAKESLLTVICPEIDFRLYKVPLKFVIMCL